MPLRSISRPSLALLVACLLAGSLPAPGPVLAESAQPTGFRAVVGEAARHFRLPSDVRLVHSLKLAALGLTLERHQQHIGRPGIAVDGAQLSVVRRAGEPVLVVGTHYPGLRAAFDGRPLIGEVEAVRSVLEAQPPEPVEEHLPTTTAGKEELHRRAGLWLDPQTGRAFYRVETRGLARRQFHEVDALSGAVLSAWDALHHDHGIGVKADRKALMGGDGAADNLTRRVNGSWRMRSADNRLITYDMALRWGGSLVAARDADNRWLATAQRSAVDAQFYARAGDRFLLDAFGFDILSEACGYGRIRSVVRFGKGYGNAFWNGSHLVYGEGDASFRALSGAQDVVAHELGHAVTQCTSALAYLDEPGALNEAFSDILAVAAEFELGEPTSSNCRRAPDQQTCPDWWIAEDVWRGGGGHGIRSLADPAAGGQPRHYAERYLGSGDNGGVHINSGIPNHAFYLLAEGGHNARCSGPFDPAPDCDVLVPGLGLASARAIAFLAYLSLPSDATFCAARTATLAAAEALHPASLVHRAAAELSWEAVGVAECPPAPSDFNVQLAARSLYLPPASTGEVELSLWRGSETGPIDLAVAGLPPEWYALGEDGLVVTTPMDAAGGAYPFSVTASSGSRAQAVHGLLVVDAEGPHVSLARPSLAHGAVVPVDGSGTPVRIEWVATDRASGLAEARVEWSVDGGEWQDVTPDEVPAAPLTLQVGPGTHTFRVVATDQVGNMTVAETEGPVQVDQRQEDAASYSAGWSAPVADPTWGSLRFTTEAKRAATFVFTGSEVAWVADMGPRRGRAKVYVDGVLAARVDLYAKTYAPRVVVFRAGELAPAAQHSLRIVALGTSGRPRVGIDGFLVLSR